MKTKKILLVDDDEIFLFLAERELKDLLSEAEFIHASNGSEAFELLKNIEPFAMFLDLNMPVMGGFDLLNKLQEEDVPVNYPIFITTSSIDPREIAHVSNYSEVVGLIEKPLNISKVWTLLENKNMSFK
ncbi:MAG: response regulator [Cytophagales bacterium]